jgi:hypothetical protein
METEIGTEMVEWPLSLPVFGLRSFEFT